MLLAQELGFPLGLCFSLLHGQGAVLMWSIRARSGLTFTLHSLLRLSSASFLRHALHLDLQLLLDRLLYSALALQALLLLPLRRLVLDLS